MKPKLKPGVQKMFARADPGSIAERVRALEEKISQAHEEIEALQAQCEHIDHNYQYWCNSGNYDPSQDCSGTRILCLDCQKRWGMSQSEYAHWAKGKRGNRVKK